MDDAEIARRRFRRSFVLQVVALVLFVFATVVNFVVSGPTWSSWLLLAATIVIGAAAAFSLRMMRRS